MVEKELENVSNSQNVNLRLFIKNIEKRIPLVSAFHIMLIYINFLPLKNWWFRMKEYKQVNKIS